jgi:RNA polymerase subunit RPABC4/transcription elongation factor Spt4
MLASFQLLAKGQGKGQEKIACPHCGGKNVEQRWSAFSVVTSKKSA